MKVLLERLMRHAGWANARTLAALRTVPVPPEEALRLFSHIAATERLYLRRMRAEDPFPQDFWPTLSLEDAATLAEENARNLVAFVTQWSEDALRQPVRYRNSKGTVFETPLDQMLTHVALHGEHHRGQVARLVRLAGGTPAVTDLITFVREQEPTQRVSA